MRYLPFSLVVKASNFYFIQFSKQGYSYNFIPSLLFFIQKHFSFHCIFHLYHLPLLVETLNPGKTQMRSLVQGIYTPFCQSMHRIIMLLQNICISLKQATLAYQINRKVMMMADELLK